MRKPAFCIFLWPLYSDIIFFFVHYCAGVSNKHWLLPFFHVVAEIECKCLLKHLSEVKQKKSYLFPLYREL